MHVSLSVSRLLKVHTCHFQHHISSTRKSTVLGPAPPTRAKKSLSTVLDPACSPPGGLDMRAEGLGSGLWGRLLVAAGRSAVSGSLSVPGRGFTAGWPPQRQGCDGQGQQQQHLVTAPNKAHRDTERQGSGALCLPRNRPGLALQGFATGAAPKDGGTLDCLDQIRPKSPTAPLAASSCSRRLYCSHCSHYSFLLLHTFL